MIVKTTDFGITDEDQIIMIDYVPLDHGIDKLSKFGWESKISIREGIKETYEYFLKESNEI